MFLEYFNILILKINFLNIIFKNNNFSPNELSDRALHFFTFYLFIKKTSRFRGRTGLTDYNSFEVLGKAHKLSVLRLP